MSDLIHARYTCERCVSTRNIQLEREEISDQIYIPENSSNGLFIYSDIHRCENGILGINNLHIDRNNDVRSYEYLKLPSEKNGRKIIKGLPSPNVAKQDLTKYRVTGMSSRIEFRLTIKDKDLGVHLIVGNVSEEDEEKQFSLNSKRGGITLNCYKCNVDESNYLKSWFQLLIDLLEVLPPTKIGLFIDTLRYISTLVKIPPVDFHINMLKTILSSHEIRFVLNDPSMDFVEELSKQEEVYGGDIIISLLQIVEKLTKTPNSSLQEFTKTQKREISDLVYLFLLLEQDGIITIQRPPEIIY